MKSEPKMEQVKEDIIQTALIEMFKRVGLDYTWDQIVAYGEADPEWYWSKTWTLAEGNDFEKWLENEFYNGKHFKGYSKKARMKIVKKEVGYFMLMWSWKTEFPSNAECREKKENK